MLFGNGLPSWAQNLYVLIGILTVDSTAPLKHPTVRFWVGVSSVLISAKDSIKQHHDVDLPYLDSSLILDLSSSSCFSFAVFVASARRRRWNAAEFVHLLSRKNTDFNQCSVSSEYPCQMYSSSCGCQTRYK